MIKVFLLGVVFSTVFGSCKPEKEIEDTPIKSIKVAVEESVSKECFIAIIKKDTFSMVLYIRENKIASGTLRYNFFEKDKNEGTLVGEIKGDTLIAAYTFMSEGISSIRQVYFLKKGNTYREGFGDIVDDNKGKVTFKDPQQLKFDGNIVLSQVDCKSSR